MQEPLHGVSMIYSFDAAAAADRHEKQYFEMVCNRGIYHKGWTVSTRHGNLPWKVIGAQPPSSEDVWELHDINKDWSQSRNLAGEKPEKLAELKRLFELEASKYNVFPLDDRKAERANPTFPGAPPWCMAPHSSCFPAYGGFRRTRRSTPRTSRTRSLPKSWPRILAPTASSSRRAAAWAAGRDESLDVGADMGEPVSGDYGPRGNAFNGKIEWVQIDIDAAAKDADHMIGADERFQLMMMRQ